ncbi:MAG: RNA polymerase sigma factor [Candidatus Aminicenantaceae bacterium]
MLQSKTLTNCWPRERTKLDDQSLIKEILDGDTNAFKELVHKYESQVAATVIGMLGPGPEAEDIGQETFLRFYRALAGFRGESSVGTYVTRIAINLCLNVIKRRVRQRELYVSDGEGKLESLGHNPETEHRDAMSHLVNLGLQRLDAKFRAVIVLRLVEGYTTRETAEILRLPEGTVLSRLARGQQKLKEILSHYYPINDDNDENAISGDGP